MSDERSTSNVGPEEISKLAHSYWMERGCENGCPDDDWFRAERELHERRPDLIPQAACERTVVGIFQSLDEAERAVADLQREGFTSDQISCVAGDGAGAAKQKGTAVAEDAGMGAALGGLGGLLIGFATLVAPGVGTILAAGPLLAALGGAGVGAATGGLIGALSENGVPEEQARHYAEGVRRGAILVSVHGRADLADLAAGVMDRNGAIDIEGRVSAWRARGWVDHNPEAAPFTKAEMRREREYSTVAKQQGKEWSAQGGKGTSSRVFERFVQSK